MLYSGLVFVSFLLLVFAICEIVLTWRKMSRNKQWKLKGTIAQPKPQKLGRAYREAMLEERDHYHSEIATLNRLSEEDSIDNETYSRYKKLLQMSHKQKHKKMRTGFGARGSGT